MTRAEPPRGTQAIQRAFRLLASFEDGGTELSLAQLSKQHSLAKPTAHRILAVLEAERWIERCGNKAAYRLAPKGRAAGALPASAEPAQTPASAFPRPTPFQRRHDELNESLAWRPWSGYAIPTHYQSDHIREYFAIRGAAGLIDVSPLFKYEIRGGDAERLVNRIMTRDVRKCRVGQVMYSCWCDDDGKMIQDGNLIRLEDQRFRISAADASLRWFEDCGYGMDVEVRDVTAELGALSLQGPRSRAILAEVLDEVDLDRLRYFRALNAKAGGIEVLVSRTGFTGDLGFELWAPAGSCEELWDLLMAAGRRHALQPVGLMAMDAARIEAGLILIEVDFVSSVHAFLEGRKSSPYDAGLGWTVKMVDGNDFVGRAALEDELRQGSNWAMVGIEIDWSELERVYGRAGVRPQTVRCPPCREPVPIFVGERKVGQVTSQVFSPVLKKQVGIASVERGVATEGTRLDVEVSVELERARANGRVVPLPFYDPPHKRALPGGSRKPKRRRKSRS